MSWLLQCLAVEKPAGVSLALKLREEQRGNTRRGEMQGMGRVSPLPWRDPGDPQRTPAFVTPIQVNHVS